MTTSARFVRASAVLTAAALAVSLFAGGAAAVEPDAPGDPDPAFGGDGFVLVETPDPDYPQLLWTTGTPRSNGGVLVASTMKPPVGLAWRPLAIMVQPDGAYDESFGDGGIVYPVIPRWSFDDFQISATAAAPLAGGVLVGGVALEVVEGRARERLWLQRYTKHGRVDRDFATNGTYRLRALDLPNREISVADNTILVCGTNNRRGKVTVIRLDETGAGLPGFGDDGRATVVTKDHGEVESCAVTPEGGVIVLQRQSHRFWLTRLTPAGELDVAFGNGGMTQGSLADNQLFLGGVVKSNGRVAIVTSNNFLPIVTKRKPNGNPDRAFGGDGYSTLVFPPGVERGYGRGIEIDPSGAVVVAGNQEGPYKAFVARLLADGSMDPSFGESGLAVYDSVVTDFSDLDLYPNGQLLATGFSDVHPPDIYARLEG